MDPDMKRQFALALTTMVLTAGCLLGMRAGYDHLTVKRATTALAAFEQGGYQPALITGRVGEPLAPLAPAAGSRSRGVTFSVYPRLPAGLALDRTTGVVTGTPRVAAPMATYTATATWQSRMAKTALQVVVADSAGK
jgi:hypothetical protein